MSVFLALGLIALPLTCGAGPLQLVTDRLAVKDAAALGVLRLAVVVCA